MVRDSSSSVTQRNQTSSDVACLEYCALRLSLGHERPGSFLFVPRSSTLSPSLSFLIVRLGMPLPEPALGSDLPDWLPPLCVPSWQDPTAFPVPTFQDLAGFWDLLQLSIEDVTLKFLELQQLKANSWKLLEPKVCLWVSHSEIPFFERGV